MKSVDFDGPIAHLFELSLERLGSVGPALAATFDAVLSGRVSASIGAEIEARAPRQHCVWCSQRRKAEGNNIADRRRSDRAFPILRAVAVETGFAISELKGDSRRSDVTKARFRAMWRLRQAGWSTAEIGRVLGGRDHSTVISGLRKFESMMAANPSLAETMRGYVGIDEKAAS